MARDLLLAPFARGSLEFRRANYDFSVGVICRVMKNTTGWGVVRLAPWHLLGIFPTSAEARIRCLEAGAKYEVRFGEGNVEENEFLWIDSGMR